MKYKYLIRPVLTIVFGFLGAWIARSGTPPDILAITGDYFILIATVTFGILGFILPDLLAIASRAGITRLAIEITKHIPNPQQAFGSVGRISFPKGRSFGRRSKNKYINPLVVDTSSLIDGRLIDVVKTGFMVGEFLIIPSVVSELQRLADNANELRRVRGRRGLDNLALLVEVTKKNKHTKVEVLTSEPDDREVDDKLVKLAKKQKAKVVTVDYNLNKVARVKGVMVLNINELANSVKTAVLPRERLPIHVSARGREKNQGVGYLSDGTMVVVEDGATLIGQTVDVTVSKVLQTPAGKMIFARAASN